MNKTQQKQINEALGMLEEAHSILEEVLGEVQDNYDNKSEKWQEGEAGEKAQEEISGLEDAINETDSAKTTVENLVENE